jgi:hypothetical protein
MIDTEVDNTNSYDISVDSTNIISDRRERFLMSILNDISKYDIIDNASDICHIA